METVPGPIQKANDMSDDTPTTSPAPPHPAMLWSGRILSGLIGAMFGMSAVMKFVGGPEMKEGMSRFGIPETMALPLGIVEAVCVIAYLIPQTCVTGAILLTGYLGGAICTHWRVGDVFVVHIILGVLLWVALWLREPRLRPLAPLRRM
ncbi:MAG: DoxX family protein [Maioricimonas sp. JB045]